MDTPARRHQEATEKAKFGGFVFGTGLLTAAVTQLSESTGSPILSAIATTAIAGCLSYRMVQRGKADQALRDHRAEEKLDAVHAELRATQQRLDQAQEAVQRAQVGIAAPAVASGSPATPARRSPSTIRERARSRLRDRNPTRDL